jgi:hypothetical protein
MSDARDILILRSKEIRAMQRYVLAFDRGDLSVAPRGGRREDATLIQNSIKAAFIMMLYNLAEAVVVSTIHEIFYRVGTEGLGFDRVATAIRSFWVEQRAARIRHGSSETHATLIREAIETALGKEGLKPFERDEIRRSYGGNVDGRVIREIAARFSVVFAPRKSSQGGQRLLSIKGTRNDLGHGIFSFSEVGATQSAGDLRETSVRVRRFLFDAVQAFDRYLRLKEYALAEVADADSGINVKAHG